MALSRILTNGTETGLSLATKINAGFDQTEGNQSSVTSLDTRVEALEETIEKNIISFLLTGINSTQPLTPNVRTKVDWGDADPFLAVGSDITFDKANSKLVIYGDGIYSISGLMTVTAPINDNITMSINIDSVVDSSLDVDHIGKGDYSTMAIPFNVLTPLSINTVIEIYAQSSGTEITLENLSFTIEKTQY